MLKKGYQSNTSRSGSGQGIAHKFKAGVCVREGDLNRLIDHLIRTEFVQDDAEKFRLVFRGH
jgi:hypothetical protein